MKKVIIILLVLLMVVSIAHAIAMPQATRCMLVDLHNFDNSGRIYYRPGTDIETVQELETLLEEAIARVDKFWGGRVSNPKIIFCDDAEDYSKFGSPFPTPAVAILHFKPYVVVSAEGIDVDILAHELSHAELAARIGILNNTFNMPIWFHEGVAMQVDYRDYYSLDTLASKTNRFQNLPDVKSMRTYDRFGAGTREQVMLNYMTAKYEIHKWHTPVKLNALIEGLNEGEDFEVLFEQ